MVYRTKNTQFTPIGDLLQTVAGHLMDHPRSKAQKLRWEWCQAVGSQVAQHTEPIRLTNGVLTVRVDSPVWFAQLHHLQYELLEKLRCRLPEGTLRELRFRQETLYDLPAWLKPKPSPPPLPEPHEEDVNHATQLVAAVDDLELQEVLHRILLAHMTRTRYEKSV